MLEHPVPIVVLIFFLKGFDRIIHADLYAEEATVFLLQALTHPFSALFHPYTGYFHTLPRIIALTGAFLPLGMIPYFFNIVCFVIAGLVFSVIISDDYRWLIPGKGHRFLIALFFCMLPGLPEIAGNLTNLHWILLLWLGLLGIRDLSSRNGWLEYVIIFLVVFSGGANVIFLPLFLTRLAFHLRDRRRVLFLQECYVIALIFLSMAIDYFLKTDQSLIQIGIDHGIVFVTYFTKFVMLFPVMGDAAVLAVAGNKVVFVTLTVVVFFLMAWIYYGHFDQKHLVFFMFLFGGSLLAPLIAMARTASIPFLLTQADYSMWYSHRYAFFGPALGYLLWSFVGQYLRWKKRDVSKYLFSFLLVVSIAGSWHRFFIHPYGVRHDWSRKTEKISSCLKTGHPRKVYVNVYPRGWLMKITTPVKSPPVR